MREVAALTIVSGRPQGRGRRGSLPRSSVWKSNALRQLAAAVAVSAALLGGYSSASARKTSTTENTSVCSRCSQVPPGTIAGEKTAPSLRDFLNQVSQEAQPARSSATVAAEEVPLTSSEIASLAHSCAPATPTSVISALIGVESGGRVLLLSVNGSRHHVLAPTDRGIAELQVTGLQRAGANFDVGLMQLNSATLARLHVPVREALEPCRNLAIGAALFEQGYASAMSRHAVTVPLLAAYSTYNTGDPVRGYANGYANRVENRLKMSAQARAPS